MKPLLSRADLKPCAKCGKGLMHSGIPIVWKMTAHRVGVDIRKIDQQAGLELMIGHAVIAAVLAPAFDYGVAVARPVEFMLCEPCALDGNLLAVLLDDLANDAPAPGIPNDGEA